MIALEYLKYKIVTFKVEFYEFFHISELPMMIQRVNAAWNSRYIISILYLFLNPQYLYSYTKHTARFFQRDRLKSNGLRIVHTLLAVSKVFYN